MLTEPAAFCTMYPNPFLDVSYVNYEVKEVKAESIAFLITDLYGKVVKRILLKELKGAFELHRENLASGFYFFTMVIDGKKSQSKKIVVL